MTMTIKILTAGVLAFGLALGTTIATGDALSHRIGPMASASLLSNESIARMKFTPAQQATWDALTRIRAESQQEAAQRLREVRKLLEVELQKPEPNLEAVDAEMEQAMDQIRGTTRTNRTAYLAFYAELSPYQKQIVAEDLTSKLERLDRVRGFLGRVLGTD